MFSGHLKSLPGYNHGPPFLRGYGGSISSIFFFSFFAYWPLGSTTIVLQLHSALSLHLFFTHSRYFHVILYYIIYYIHLYFNSSILIFIATLTTSESPLLIIRHFHSVEYLCHIFKLMSIYILVWNYHHWALLHFCLITWIYFVVTMQTQFVTNFFFNSKSGLR